jgi:sulfur-oxidizing protein SoxB
MNLSKREFLQVLGAASVAGMGLGRWADADAATAQKRLYDLPRFGNVSFLHMTDCHAQLLPIHFREPSVNLGIGSMQGNLPHLVGDHLLKLAGVKPGTDLAHAYTYLDFEKAARRYGKVGGFAHLATLVKQLKASRPGALLLDGGDTWQGSATSLWTNAQDMVDACKLLTVDVMTGHWEFTYGMERVKEIIEKDFKGKVDFVAQNVKTNDFGDPVFAPIGQAFPYTPIANPRYMVADWGFGIQDDNMQKMVDEARGKGAQVVVVISHNGMDVDLKMAASVRGIDVIFGGHTHDGIPAPTLVENSGGKTLVTNAGSNGKFLGVMDLDVGDGKVRGYRYRLLPVFANLLPADAAMQAYIDEVRRPYLAQLTEPLAVTETTLYRRGNFNGTFDQVICNALRQGGDAEIALSPGFRWGTTVTPGSVITLENVLDQTAITYPATYVREMRAANSGPFWRTWPTTSSTRTPISSRGATWCASVGSAQGGRVKPRTINTPKLVGVAGNPGMAG